jgi:hypothetical protein
MAKGSKPDFIARANVGKEDSDFFINIGAAWSWKNGDGFVVKLHSKPLDWDGSFILAKPKEVE